MIERRKPKFVRRQTTISKRLKKRSAQKWLRPRGRDNKMRLKFKGVARKAEIGWGNKKSEKGTHGGQKTTLVSNLNQLVELKKGQAVILKKIGKKKRDELIKYANEKGLIIKNRYTGGKNNATS